MKVLVTGATGFIGKYVIKELYKLGYEIIATGLDPEFNFNSYKKAKITYVPCDLDEQRDDYYNLFFKPDLCIHLAWQGLPNYNELFHIEKNLFTNYYFIRSLVEKGLPHLTALGTCFEYGLQQGCLSESLDPRPMNSYGVAKDTLRKFIEILNSKYNFCFQWIRLFYLHGEGQNKNSVLEQLKRALANNETVFNMSAGEQLRDYLPVEQVAENIVKISLQNQVSGIINCCSGQPISVRKFVENYLQIEKKTINLNLGYYPYSDNEPMAFWGDTTKLKKALSLYRPITSHEKDEL
jgi:nucleoside-diphosphate-sugar epimerase